MKATSGRGRHTAGGACGKIVGFLGRRDDLPEGFAYFTQTTPDSGPPMVNEQTWRAAVSNVLAMGLLVPDGDLLIGLRTRKRS